MPVILRLARAGAFDPCETLGQGRSLIAAFGLE